MKAIEQFEVYQDLVGDAAADLAKQPNSHDSNLQYFADKFGIDSQKFKIVGLELYGVKDPRLCLICENLLKSTESKSFISKIEIQSETFDIEDILEGLHIVLYKNFDERYSKLNVDEELRIEDIEDKY